MIYHNSNTMTKIKLSVMLLFYICFITAVFATLSNSDFCNTASNPGSTALDPNFVKKTNG